MIPTNAPLNIEGRRRLIEQCHTRPIVHVAAPRKWLSMTRCSPG